MFGVADIFILIIFVFLYIFWKKRGDNSNGSFPQDTLTDRRACSTILDAQKNLETASQQWRKRVEPSDAVNYSVAGRMHQEVQISESVLNFAANGTKRTPKANRFRGREGEFFVVHFAISFRWVPLLSLVAQKMLPKSKRKLHAFLILKITVAVVHK